MYAKLANVMQENKPQRPKRKVPWVLGTIVFVLLLVLVLLQSSNLWKSFSAETASDTLLLYALSSLNFVAFIIVGFIFLRSIVKLARERRAFQLGAKMKTRLLAYFFALSFLPIVAMAVFSYLFMNRALERWFTSIPENVIREAREVQGQSLLDRSVKIDESARMLAATFIEKEPKHGYLESIANAGNLAYIEILRKDGSVAASYERPVSAEQLEELKQLVSSIHRGELSDPAMRDGKGFDIATAEIGDGRKLIIVPDAFGQRTVSQIVENSLSEFDRLKEKQVTVRQVGLLTLGVLTFLLIFASSWVALHVARGLAEPVKALAEGASQIAGGNLGYRVDAFAEDELAILVSAFNEMSATLEANSTEINDRQKFIETVVATLPNGVISFDADMHVSTINQAASSMLKLDTDGVMGGELGQLVSGENLKVVERLLSRAKRVGRAAEQTVLIGETIADEISATVELPVALTAAALPDANGVVLVIEDLSELISAQRASAWQEVARRMAHEIKNPLTPIQLSAERISKRFAQHNGTENGNVDVSGERSQLSELVAESTATILREVSSLKTMVGEFSRFARLPDANLASGDINDVVEQALGVFEGRFNDIDLIAELGTDLPLVDLDPEQLKRVFVNLIENAAEAFDRNQADKKIVITTRHEPARGLIVSEVIDNGKGISAVDLQKLFQPYFSTKGRGTGLGLAIVNRIVAEHKGRVKAVGNQTGGAKFIIEIPVAI